MKEPQFNIIFFTQKQLIYILRVSVVVIFLLYSCCIQYGDFSNIRLPEMRIVTIKFLPLSNSYQGNLRTPQNGFKQLQAPAV